jgi:hypothetical protein
MNTVSKPTGPTAAAFAIVGIAMAYSASSFAFNFDDELLGMYGEFEIGNAESKVIAYHNSPEPYRVCVAKSPDSVPVRARYDGQERTIGVGECDDLTARIITLSPAGKLHGDAVLLGKYEHLKE